MKHLLCIFICFLFSVKGVCGEDEDKISPIQHNTTIMEKNVLCYGLNKLESKLSPVCYCDVKIVVKYALYSSGYLKNYVTINFYDKTGKRIYKKRFNNSFCYSHYDDEKSINYTQVGVPGNDYVCIWKTYNPYKVELIIFDSAAYN